jgi:lipoprotein-anchoring transpeptidase ErfK/SrfK
MTGAGSAANGRFFCVAVLAVGLVIGADSRAEAARYYWSHGEPDFYWPAPRPWSRQHKVRHGQAQKTEKPERDAAKPQGPLIIAISINQQRLKIYDAHGVFAESPVSTGMRGHPTPMGVFSVIQKHKFHRSNIYSNAPMPYMQRITWSGVAMHAGVLPGYPASHGCIRMPMAFAIKMWNWTRMGARVVVTPGELTPATFAHALLPSQKVAPQPIAAVEPEADEPVGAKTSKGALEAKSPISSPISEAANSEAANTKAASSAAADVGADLALRTSLGHDESVKTAPNGMTPPLREQTHTADAGGDRKASQITMSDASSGSSMPRHEDGAAKSESMPSASADTAKLTATSGAKAEDSAGAAKRVDAPASDGKPTAAAPGARPAETGAKTPEIKIPEIKTQDAKPQDTASVSAKVGARPDDKSVDAKIETKAETRIDTAKPDLARIEPAKAADAAVDIAKDKDQARLNDAAKDKAATTKTDPPRRPGQIAVFISRKDSKLYVRQNFSPLFEVPITIAPSDRPLGTHIFTADVDKKDTNLLHWSVVTLPVSARGAIRADNEEHGARRKTSAAVEAKPLPVPDTPAEALDRIGLPAEAMTRVSDALTSGGSIIVSDQGINQGETGEGTDFIVSLR